MRIACATCLLLLTAGMASGQVPACASEVSHTTGVAEYRYTPVCDSFQRERERESWSFRPRPSFQFQPRFAPQSQPSFRFDFERRRGLLRRERLRLEFGAPYESPTFRFRGG